MVMLVASMLAWTVMASPWEIPTDPVTVTPTSTGVCLDNGEQIARAPEPTHAAGPRDSRRRASGSNGTANIAVGVGLMTVGAAMQAQPWRVGEASEPGRPAPVQPTTSVGVAGAILQAVGRGRLHRGLKQRRNR